MITYSCDVCGEPAIARTAEGLDFADSKPLPELVYQGIHVVFSARKHPLSKPPQHLPPHMLRDTYTADLCRECLLKAITDGAEMTRQDFEKNPAVRP